MPVESLVSGKSTEVQMYLWARRRRQNQLGMMTEKEQVYASPNNGIGQRSCVNGEYGTENHRFRRRVQEHYSMVDVTKERMPVSVQEGYPL